MNLPEKHKQNLIEAHEECAEIIRHHGGIPEPLETAILAEDHRWFWKPKDVGFILVGESHVYTNKDEIKVRIIPNRLPKEVPKSVPLNFVKLVYCFGYGEPYILDKPEKIENNPGTRQYDDLFRMCAGFDETPFDKSGLQWKAKVLTTLKERGFWLLDASCHACYLGRKKRLPTEIVKRIVPISWRKYVKPIIEETSTDKKRIWIIGKGLRNILCAHDEFVKGLNWIYQPNAHFKDPEKYHEKRFRERQLKKATEQYRSEIHGTANDITLEDTVAEVEHRNGYVINTEGRVISGKQAQYAKYVEELKQKGIRGEEYRKKTAQWRREHQD
jgi:hypothetical protein